jgi:alpha-glucosidase
MRNLLSIGFLLAFFGQALAATQVVKSPDGRLAVTVSDDNRVSYRVDLDQKPVVTASGIGLFELARGNLGSSAKIESTKGSTHKGTWEDRFGTERTVLDNWNQVSFTLTQNGIKMDFIVRVFDNGVALRYAVPKQAGFPFLNLKDEDTEFNFAGDYRAWTGDPSVCAENNYPERTISATPNLSVLPALVETPNGYVAIAESDLTNWAGMFLKPNGPSGLKVDLAPRRDGKGAVIIMTPAISPWRVIMIGRTGKDLLTNNLVKTLATPNQIGDTSWIKPGITAWDAWWANSIQTRGTTETHKPYIDLATRMGWPYMLCDWGWCEGDDLTRPNKNVDIPGLIEYAKGKKVKLLLWMHSDALNKTGIDKAFSTVAKWGVAGVKVDFMNSDSQETVQWYVNTLATAAKYKLLVDFHGAYKPTGLARTYPNYITQEGVLGNEYNKIRLNVCSISHTMILPFTRALLGPMDFTPGGFQNVLPSQFVLDAGKNSGGNCQVLGTRAHQLALTMIYPSPLLVLCDSPTSYLGSDLKHPEPGLEFYRDLPTVWDETRIIGAKVGRAVVIARRSGKRWWLAAMNGNDRVATDVPLSFLGSGKWTMRAFMDAENSETEPKSVFEQSSDCVKATVLSVRLAAGGGGFVAILTPKGK